MSISQVKRKNLKRKQTKQVCNCFIHREKNIELRRRVDEMRNLNTQCSEVVFCHHRRWCKELLKLPSLEQHSGQQSPWVL